MTRFVKSTMMVITGVGCLMVAVVIGLFVFQYLTGGAGGQVFGFFGVTSTGVLIGIVHLTGFLAGTWLCFVVGVVLCAHGLVPPPKPEKEAAPRPVERVAYFRQLISSLRTREVSDGGLRCACCRAPLAQFVHICHDCGWTQPYDYKPEQIRRERTAKGMTQEALAELCDLNTRTVQKIEAGQINILVTTLRRLRRTLECSWQRLLD